MEKRKPLSQKYGNTLGNKSVYYPKIAYIWLSKKSQVKYFWLLQNRHKAWQSYDISQLTDKSLFNRCLRECIQRTVNQRDRTMVRSDLQNSFSLENLPLFYRCYRNKYVDINKFSTLEISYVWIIYNSEINTLLLIENFGIVFKKKEEIIFPWVIESKRWKLIHWKELSISWNTESRNWVTDYLLWSHLLPCGGVPCHNACTSVCIK